MRRRTRLPAAIALCVILGTLASVALADEAIYGDSLSSAWENWSWSSTINFASTASPKQGTAAIRAVLGQWGALSLKKTTGTIVGSGLEFWIAYDPSAKVEFYADATGAGVSSNHIDVKTIQADPNAQPSTGTLVRCIVDISALTPARTDWNRFSIFDGGGTAPTVTIDTINVLTNLPAGAASLNIFGARSVLLSSVTSAADIVVRVNGVVQTIAFTDVDAANSRLLVQLASDFAPGATVQVTLADGTTTLQATVPSPAPLTVNVDFGANGYPISELIYGHAFPTASSITALRIPSARWGGNAVSTFNPFKNVTNAAQDWFYENRPQENGGAEGWLATVKGRGAKAFFTVPIMDWVSKDATSYSYSKTAFPDQTSFDPWKPDAGNGVASNGTLYRANPNTAYEAWTQARLKTWLSTLPARGLVPEVVAAGNEIDICASTHRDMHYDKITYAEMLQRVKDTADTLRTTPGFEQTKLAAPSSCCWFYYWNSDAGSADKAANGGTDFLVWFLQQMKAFSDLRAKRMLDQLDIHYYPNDVFNDAVDAATRAKRLRSPRSLWDPTYKDEGWIGRDGQWSTNQPNPNYVYLIPRFRDLIAQNYPGTSFGIHEWNFGAEADISGGLAVTDVLGIFAREKLDAASYWTSPAEGSAAWLGWWIVRGGRIPFGSTYLPITFSSQPNWDLTGVYAAHSGGNTTLLLVNKDPSNFQAFAVGSGVAAGQYSVKYFGQSLGIRKFETNLCLVPGDKVLLPPYTAAHLAYAGAGSCGSTPPPPPPPPPATSTAIAQKTTTAQKSTTVQKSTTAQKSPTVRPTTVSTMDISLPSWSIDP
ncbi:glycoside hydrolase family 44-domain-containing protein [Hyaloraphidium curvatum]|nr:glycoside hydrolase family 44-domain-containing protein [Hyaloraphidium curvatum]